MKKNNYLSDEIKLKIVGEVLSGELTKEQARRLYNIKSKSGILEWMRNYANVPVRSSGVNPTPILKDMSNPLEEPKQLKARIKQLEEELKISKLKGKAYQVMVEIAKHDYGIDLEKKSGAKQSKSSEK